MMFGIQHSMTTRVRGRSYQNSLLLILLLFLFVSGTFAQTAGSRLREQAALVSEFEVNGLKVLVKRRPTASTVAAGLFIRGGALNIDSKNAGIESLMLETARESSRKFPRETLRRDLAATGTVISSGINLNFSALSMAATRENFRIGWDMFTDIAVNPSFDPVDLGRVKDRVLTRLRESETDNDTYLGLLQERVVYKGHPYSNDVQGTVATVPGITADDLRKFHAKVMKTSRLLLVVVGNVEPDEVRSMTAETLGKLPRGSYKKTAPPSLQFSKPSLDVTSRTLPTNYVQGVFSAPPLNDPDYYPMKVAIAVLQARLFQEVRVRRQLSYAPNAELNSNAANTGFIYVTAAKPNEAVNVMLDEVDNLKNRLVNYRLLSGISGHFLTLHFMDQETNAAQARELAKYELIGGGWRNSFGLLDGIRSVTPEQVRAVARKYLANIRFIVIGNPAAINRMVFLRTE